MDKLNKIGRYTKPQIALHNLMALLVVCIYVFGLSLESFDKSVRGDYVNLHALAGLTLFALLVVRLLLRAKNPPPPLPESMGPSFAKAAHLGHYALYALMAIVPMLGLSARLSAGRGLNFFVFQVASPFAGDKGLAHTLVEAHGFCASLLIIVAAGHLLIALYHQFVLKDNLLSRLDPRAQK